MNKISYTANSSTRVHLHSKGTCTTFLEHSIHAKLSDSNKSNTDNKATSPLFWHKENQLRMDAVSVHLMLQCSTLYTNKGIWRLQFEHKQHTHKCLTKGTGQIQSEREQHTRMPNKGYWTNSVGTRAAHCPVEMTASHYKSVTTQLTTDWTSSLPLTHGRGVIRKRDGDQDKKPTDVQLQPIACTVTVHPLLNHTGACAGPTLWSIVWICLFSKSRKIFS